MVDEVGAGLLPIPAMLIDPLPIQRQVLRQIHVQNCSSRITIGTAHFNLTIDAPWPQHSRVDQIRPVRSQNDHHIL